MLINFKLDKNLPELKFYKLYIKGKQHKIYNKKPSLY